MTPEEIRDSPAEAKTQMGWLKEIAYQLALLNKPKPEIADRPQLTNPAFVVTTTKAKRK